MKKTMCNLFLCFAVFLFMGVQSASAQYLDGQTAEVVMTQQVEAVQAQFEAAIVGSETYIASGRKLIFYRNILKRLTKGNSTEAALETSYALIPDYPATLSGGNSYPRVAEGQARNLYYEAQTLLAN